MFVFKHPKYYKELRERNKSDQVISNAEATAASERAPDPGLKLQASTKLVNACIDQREPQAPSSKQQAPSAKLQEKI
jgi:hypothetical protein